MALRKRGKAGYWHAYFDTVRETEDGLRRVRTTISLGDAKAAKILGRNSPSSNFSGIEISMK